MMFWLRLVSIAFHLSTVVESLHNFETCTTGQSLKVKINEAVPIGTVLFCFQENENISYYFYEDDHTKEAMETFQISLRGTVKNNVRLDVKRGQEYSLIVLAKHRNAWTTVCSLTLTIEDVDNHYPRFKKDLYIGNIKENQPKNSLVRGLHNIYATDGDMLPVKTYRILPGRGAEKFVAEIEDINGIKFLNIRSKIPLDRENESFYMLNVQASDHGDHKTITKVQIHVDDVNDCKPVFKSKEYIVTVLKSTAVSSQVLKIHAEDCDLNENAEIYYYFKKEEKKMDYYFTIEPHTGVIRVSRVLHNINKKLIQMTVVAKDRGSQATPVEVLANFQIHEGDKTMMNSALSPHFFKSSYVVQIREDLPLNSHIFFPDVVARRDTVYFTIASNDEMPFKVNDKCGFLYLVKNLNFLMKQRYELNLTLMEATTKLNQTFITVLVKSSNKNFHTPVFRRNNIGIHVKRYKGVSHIVKAIDPDEGLNGELKYSIDEGDSRFILDSKTGYLSTMMDNSYEGFSEFGLVIEARDSALRWRAAKQFILIKVLGDLDCNPMFDSVMYEATVEENIPRGAFVAVTKARLCQEQTVEYFITDGNEENKFEIDLKFGKYILLKYGSNFKASTRT